MSGAAILATPPHQIDPGVVSVAAIARSLSCISRYNGHGGFYSVAEHCCHVCDLAPIGHKRVALMHDAVEAIVGDMPVHLRALFPDHEALERTIWLRLAPAFSLPAEMPQAVVDIDHEIRVAEIRALFGDAGVRVLFGGDPPATTVGATIHRWQPDVAEREFLARAVKLGLVKKGETG